MTVLFPCTAIAAAARAGHFLSLVARLTEATVLSYLICELAGALNKPGNSGNVSIAASSSVLSIAERTMTF